MDMPKYSCSISLLIGCRFSNLRLVQFDFVHHMYMRVNDHYVTLGCVQYHGSQGLIIFSFLLNNANNISILISKQRDEY